MAELKTSTTPPYIFLKIWNSVSYSLYFAVALFAILKGLKGVWLVIGVLLLITAIDWGLRAYARGTFQESHYRWRITSIFIVVGAYSASLLIWSFLAAPTTFFKRAALGG